MGFTCAILLEICALNAESRACSVVLRTITTGPDFSVTVSDRGHPISGLRLKLAGTQMITDKAGVVAFRDIAPGQYIVSVDHDDGVSDAVDLHVKTNGPRDVRVQLGWPAVPPIEVRSLAGTLNLAEPYLGFSSPTFDVYVLNGLTGRVLRHAVTTSGAFNYSDLPRGSYFLRVHQATSAAAQFAPVEGLIAVNVNSNTKQSRLNLVLGMTSCGLMYTNAEDCLTSEIQMQPLSGQVVDAAGAAISKADVLVFATADVPTLITKVKTDPNGNFAVHDLSAGSYLLEIAAPGFTPARATLRIGRGGSSGRPLNIQLGLLGECSAVNSR